MADIGATISTAAGSSTPPWRMLQLPERLAQHDLLLDRDDLAPDDRGIKPELGLAAMGRGVREHAETGGDHRPHRRVAERIGRIVEPSGAEVSEPAGAGHHRTLHLIRVVQHCVSELVVCCERLWGRYGPPASKCCAAASQCALRQSGTRRHRTRSIRRPNPPAKPGTSPMAMVWGHARRYPHNCRAGSPAPSRRRPRRPCVRVKLIIERGFGGGNIAPGSVMLVIVMIMAVATATALLLRAWLGERVVPDISLAVHQQPAAPRAERFENRPAENQAADGRTDDIEQVVGTRCRSHCATRLPRLRHILFSSRPSLPG